MRKYLVTGLLIWIAASLDTWGVDPSVLALTRPYLVAVSWSALPLLLYAAFRRYLQGMHLVKPVMFALVCSASRLSTMTALAWSFASDGSR